MLEEPKTSNCVARDVGRLKLFNHKGHEGRKGSKWVFRRVCGYENEVRARQEGRLEFGAVRMRNLGTTTLGTPSDGFLRRGEKERHCTSRSDSHAGLARHRRSRLDRLDHPEQPPGDHQHHPLAADQTSEVVNSARAVDTPKEFFASAIDSA
jgi:hypothetical protein